MAKNDGDTEDEATAQEITTRLERLARLLRQAGHAGGLVPAQWEVLRYLARANRLSRSPGVLARYLGSTKGTVSQSLQTLVKKGLVNRQTRSDDERHALLDLTPSGRTLLAQDPLQAMATDVDSLGGKTRRRFASGLAELLSLEIDRQGATRFGTCGGCRHFQDGDKGKAPHCAIDGGELSREETALLCIAHEGSDV